MKCECGCGIYRHHNYGLCQTLGCDCKKFIPGPHEVCPECKHEVIRHWIERTKRCELWCGCNYVLKKFPETSPDFVRAPDAPQKPNERKNMATATVTKNDHTLPDGSTYIERKVAGFDSDVAALRELHAAGEHVLLLGDPGTGKTALTQIAFPDAENELGHSKMQAPDMLWRPRIDPDSEHGVTYDPAPLTRAAKNGKVLYFDEIMRGSEDAMTPLFSAMDGRGFIVGGELDGTDLHVKEGFGVIGASNPLVRGAFLPDAIASRFHILTLETSEELLIRMKLDERLLVIWRNLSAMNDGEMWRPSIRDLKRAQKFIDAGNLPQAAFSLTGFRVPARDRAAVADAVGPLIGVRVGADGGLIK